MTETPPPSSPGGGARGSDRSMVWWLAAALVIGVAVAGGIWIVVAGPDDSSGAEPAPSSNVPSSTVPSATETGSLPSSSPAAGCDVGQSSKVPAQAPATDWKLVQGVALPFSDAFGPLKVQDPLARCFERSATGALFAAAQISIRIGLPGREEVFRSQVLPGPTRDQLLKSPPAFLSAPFPQWNGFRILASSNDRVTVQLLQRLIYNNQSVFAAHTLQMQWADGDWKWDIDPPGGFIEPVRVSSTSGYVQWSGA
jgi:hypothetical protein